MPGAGTDKTKNWVGYGPAIILVEPQLGENIGAVARAMANFCLSDLRLVKPRQWPSEYAEKTASGAVSILENAIVYQDIASAVKGLHKLYAATARDRAMAKPVFEAHETSQDILKLSSSTSVPCGILFGRERTGLYTQEVALADAIMTYPVNPAFASLNLGQAVLLFCYEWFKSVDGKKPFTANDDSPPATKDQVYGLFEHLESELDAVNFFRPPEKRTSMVHNLRNILHRMQPSLQDVQTLRGVIKSLVRGPIDK